MADFYGELDAGIRDAVRLLRDHGWNTTCSCEGGEGHSSEKPSIDIALPNTVSGVEDIANLLVENGHKVFKIETVMRVPGDGFYDRRATITLGDWR